MSSRKNFRDWPLRRKLGALGFALASLVLLLTTATFTAVDFRASRLALLEHVSSIGDLVAENAGPLLVARHRNAAQALLTSLCHDPNVYSAAIYDAQGMLVVAVNPGNASPMPPSLHEPHSKYFDWHGSLLVSVPIPSSEGTAGSIYIRATTRPTWIRLAKNSFYAFCGFTVMMLLLVVGASRIRRFVSGPISNLVAATREVTQTQNYSLRVEKMGNDELGELADSFNTMIAHIAERDAQLQASAALHRSIALATNDMIWTADPHFRFVESQKSWQDYTGQAVDDPTRLDWISALHPDDREPIAEIALGSIERGDAFMAEARLYHAPSDSYRWTVAKTEPVYAADGSLQSWIGTVSDIHDRKLAETALAKTASELAETNAELESFAHIVSHDLKAPLRGIASLGQWLYEDYYELLGEDGRENLDLLITRTQRMHNLIEGVLRYSQTGRSEGHPEDLDSGAIVRETVAAVEIPAGTKVTITDDFPVVHYDATQLRQVLQNLLDNAIKHAEGQSVTIKITCEEAQSCWQFAVSDTGPGIDPEQRTRIFEMFQTLKPRDEFESTGIGLALVKRIVERHGGRVGVAENSGPGATFWFTVPKPT